MNESRDERLAEIKHLVAIQSVSNQDELVKLLTAAGFHCTQSSVSRDLADLGVTKSNGRYVIRERGLVQQIGVLTGMPAGPNLLVVKTATGAAQLVALQIDQIGLSEIIGTIAGDDTIFIATGSERDQSIVASAIGIAL